jgi:hypothetical protein
MSLRDEISPALVFGMPKIGGVQMSRVRKDAKRASAWVAECLAYRTPALDHEWVTDGQGHIHA